MSKSRQLSVKYIAKDFLALFRANPIWHAKEIQQAVKEKHKWLAYNAKNCTYRMVLGSMRDHYSKIGCYLAALKKESPTSTFELLIAPPGFNNQDPNSNLETFFRLFVYFDGVKRGFLAGCRKLLCLDGCFLKTFLGGMLLAAIGRDANDQMYLLAWAVVEGESIDSWEWFMEELRKGLEVKDGGKDWTLISDQQKGLLNAVSLVWKNAEHRNCPRHIFANWYKNFKGGELKAYFWQACRAYNEADFNDAISKKKEISVGAVEAFMKQNPQSFVRCFLKNHTCCDVIVSNMAETFNGSIVKSRSKHIIYMLEDILVSTMIRLTEKHSEMVAKDVVVCPRIQDKLDKAKKFGF
ncbi:uncharacterized protein LOC143530648 [Bidens hawaiensis]|uniref:uncharacterized protein LOC143530648 n=1 Tax=Bidens hawaiensis TaxID=980011 RepID=UPI00404AC88E